MNKYSLTGIITGLVMIAVQLVAFYVLKMPDNGSHQYLVMAIFCAGVAYAVYLYGKEAPAGTGLGSYFQAGFKAFIPIILLMVVFTFIFYKLNPQILEQSISENNKLILEEQNRTGAEIKNNEANLRRIFMPMMLSATMFKYLILGALTSLIGAGFFMSVKK